MDEIYQFLETHVNEDMRLSFDIPTIWPKENGIVCRMMHRKLNRRRDFILTPDEFPYLSAILNKAYKEIMNNTYIDDLHRFSVSKED